MQISQSSKRFAVRVVIAGILMLAAFNYSIKRPITDSFHEGEYLGALWSIRAYLSGAAPFPLLVHGPMDFIPVLLAGALSQDQATIVLTRAINTTIIGVAWFLFFDILLKLSRWNEYRFAAGLVSTALFVGMVLIVPADAVERQQAFVAIRDIFLIVALWCMLSGLTISRPLARHAMMLVGGVAAGASLYWAYDRFLAVVAFGGGLVLVLLLQRAWRTAATLIVGGIIGLFVIPLVAPTGSLAENVGNLAYWLKFSGEVWYLPILISAPAVPTAVAMIVLLFVFARAWLAKRKQQSADPSLAFLAGLLTLQAFFLLKYFNLPRQPNNYYFVWPFVLLLAGLTLRWPVFRKIDEVVRDLWAAIVAKGLRQPAGFVAVMLSLAVIVGNNAAVAAAMNLRAIIRPPMDAELLPAAITAATRGVTLPADGCVLLWSNEGVFATALHRPFCTRYMYSVYVSAGKESDLLRQIKASPPAIVIFDSPFWSMNIYGRTMQQRLPEVDRYLRTNYIFTTRDGYSLGVRRS